MLHVCYYQLVLLALPYSSFASPRAISTSELPCSFNFVYAEPHFYLGSCIAHGHLSLEGIPDASIFVHNLHLDLLVHPEHLDVKIYHLLFTSNDSVHFV